MAAYILIIFYMLTLCETKQNINTNELQKASCVMILKLNLTRGNMGQNDAVTKQQFKHNFDDK